MTISNKENINNPINSEEAFVFPASYGQKRMWFLDQFEPNSPYYNIPIAFRLKGKLDISLFEKTINEIVRRHESIRTIFTTMDGEPVQVITPSLDIDIDIIDLTDVNNKKIEEQIKIHVTKEARTPFNISKGPLFRVKVLFISETEFIVTITMHHIISDGWSMGILVGEITAIYSAFLKKEDSPLPELEIQYADFSEWQNEYLKGELLEQQLSYWKDKLQSSNSLLELPTDRSRQAVYTNNGSASHGLISKEIIDKLQKISNAQNATIFMSLLAVFNVLLFKYSGQDDINVGTPIANRTDKDVEKIIGLFINTLVLRTNLSDDPTFEELLTQVRKTNLEAFENQDLPFEMLVDAIQPERNMSYAPLFQVMFILQNNPISTTRLTELELSMVEVDMGTSTSDITYSIAVGTNGAHCSIEYNTDLFDATTIERMFEDFTTLLSNIVKQPTKKISDLNLLDSVKKHKIITEWNSKNLALPEVEGIHSLVERWADKTPNEIAVVVGEENITYKELDERANRLANFIVSKNNNKKLPIGISLDKSVNLLVVVLGVLKSGNAYLPLDPTYPEERLAYMIDDSQIELLITDKSNKEIFKTFTKTKIVIDELDELEKQNSTKPNVKIHDNDLAYIIYTSGSTGKAKGTMVQHNSLINIYLSWEKDYTLLDEVKSHLQMASFSFDVFGGDWTRALCSGGKLVLVNREELLQADKLYETIVHEKIDIAEFVPAVLRNLISYVEENSFNLNTFKILIAGSDVWNVKEYNDFKKYCRDDVRLINSFGLTEATIDSTFFEDKNLTLPEDRLVPIGIPFYNIQILILDDYLKPVPIGVKGELFIGGISLARGYYKRPDLTAERFIPNKYSKKAGERLYKTGDVARYLPDGNIEFLGRADNQIKLRGFRIELGEIESALAENENIKDAIVIAKGNTDNDKILVAYIITIDNAELETNILRNYLAEFVPDYMIPSAFVKMEKFPLTPNGKVDRKSLPDSDKNQIQQTLETDFVAPRNINEVAIAKIWSEILNIKLVGINHNFFILGGHSLLATQVISRIKKELMVDLPLRFIFERPTVAALANEVEKLKLSSSTEVVEIKPRESSERIPLSFAQERLWFLDQLEPNSPFYNIPETYIVKGDLDTDIIEQSFDKVVERHEILRTYFASEDGTPYQIIDNKYKINIPIIDISHIDKNKIDKEIQKIISKETKTHIPLNKLPLFIIKIIKTAKDEYLFSIVIHHIISDDWSTKVIMREIATLYSAYTNKMTSPLEKLKIQYADFAIWQRDWLKGDVLKSHIKYWKEHLENVPALLELPIDKPRPNVQTFNGDFISFELEEELSNSIQKLSSKEGVTTFMVLLATFNLLLSKLSGQGDICIGTPIANRNRNEIEPLVGFFVNTLAMRTRLDDHASFLELINNIKEVSLGAYAHQDLPFEYIVEAIQPERNMSHSPIFQVMFVYQSSNPNNVGASSSTLSIEPIEAHSGTSKFDLTLFMVGSNNRIGGAFEYNTDLFEKETVERFINNFKNLLNEAILNSEQSISKINLLSNNEQRHIVNSLLPKDEMQLLKGNIIQEFSRVAKTNYNEVSIEFENREYTFEELEKESSKLANYLIAKGVKTESIVGICLPRSYRLISTLLGILKTGAAYLPIDPKYPQERIDYIIDDSNAKLVITDEETNKLFTKNNIKVISLDNEKDEILNENNDIPNVDIEDDNLCYVIYTSGSTGKPKGTLLTHKGLRNYLSWTLHTYPFTEKNGSLVHSTISFDATVTSIFPSLLAGKRLVVMNETENLDKLVKAVSSNSKFSIIKITPAHLELLSNLLPGNEAKDVAGSMIIGGENLTTNHIKYWQKNSPNTLMFNEYGPTEAVVGCVVYEGSKYKENGSVPIGKVIPNMKIFVLDENLNQVPLGVLGELYIGGVSLARGYIGKPELTAEKFIPNPFAIEEGERIYKTGDIVKVQNDGNLVFMGRVDDQVKVRGYRIELGEIEAVLNEVEKIKESVVDIKEFDDDDKRIIAYIVQAESVDKNDVLKELRKNLPEYMIPSAIIEISEIPLTINGKVDRKKLAVSNDIIRDEQVEYVPPATETENKLYSIWSDILSVEKIGVYDNFFSLGGHSLLVTKLIVRIEKSFKIKIPIQTIFEFPTIALLSNQIDNGKFSSNMLLPEIVHVDNKENIPLSFTQHRLWFLDQLDPGQAIYNMPMALKVKGELNTDLLNKSLNFITDRHETLRTNISEKKGVPYQVIHGKSTLIFETIDLTKDTNKIQTKKIETLKKEEAFKPFNLKNDSLFRVKLAILGDIEFVIFFTMHHIISDGWSINILVSEFIETYISYINEREPNLQPLKIQYSDFAIWQDKYLSGEVLDNQLNYWKIKLSNQPPIIELPTDKPRPAVKTFNGSHLSFNISNKLKNKLEQFSREIDITSFMLLLGSFQLLLSKYTGQNDISVGTPIANRNEISTEKIIGFFANTLVIRNEIKVESTVNEFFKKVKQTSLEAFSNQDVPFEKLVEVLNPERELSYTPLFQVMFVLQNSNTLKAQPSELSIIPIESESSTTQYDLTLSMNAAQEQWSGTLEYNTDLFNVSTIESIVSNYLQLLENLTIDKNIFLSRIELLDKGKIESIIKLSKGENKKLVYENVIEKFEQITKEYPNRIVLESDTKKTNYSQLEKSSNKIANYLKTLNVKNEEVIGVMLSPSTELIEWLLGIMKAGCVYMPIDLNYPDERKYYMVKDSNIKKIVTTEKNIFEINNNIKWIEIDKQDSLLKNISDKKSNTKLHRNNLAYQIYTSGSTGKPKGVMLKHIGLLNLAERQIKIFDVTNKSRVLQFASTSFDASLSEIFMVLLSGATLCITDRSKLTNSLDIEYIISKREISVITLPPSLLNVIRVEKVESLSTIISAGEKLNKDVADKWKDNVKLVNAYGPTEATVGVSSYIVKNIFEEGSSIPIGSPMVNISIYLLDENLKLVPKGVVGEIYIGGVSLSRGYKNKPELTAENFIPNPFANYEDENKLYRTGDIARYAIDGEIEFIGRKDEQVKVRGFRIELNEIEVSLRNIDEIEEAILIADGEGEKRKLIAYLKTEKVIDDKEIKMLLGKNLPDYMIPSFFIKIDEVPLTPNGKIDKKKLPKVDEIEISNIHEYVAPNSNIEKSMVTIWQQLLEIKKIGITDNFFNIGGHSLIASQLISRLQDEYKIDLPIRKLFETPTIRELSLEVEILKTYNNKTLLPLLSTKQVDEIPLSFAQQRLWFLDQLEPGNSFYNLPSAIKITGELNILSLQKSINSVANRHEILRTTFVKKKGKAFQQISDLVNIKIKTIDISNFEESKKEVKTKESLTKEFLTPFNLEEETLIRATIIKLSENKNIFILTMHHIISDGWSMSILINEIIHFYNSIENGITSKLDDLPVQYKDYAIWQREWLSGKVLNEHIEYWKKQLQNIPALISLPYDRQRPPVQTFKGNTIAFKLTKENVDEIKKFSNQQNVTLFMTLLSVFQLLLNRYSGQEDIVVGTPIANRNNTKIEKLIGFFINTLALKSTIDNNLSFKETVRRVKDTVLSAYSHQDLPFETLVDSLKLKRDMSYTPVFQVMFTLQNIPQGKTKTTNLTLEPIDADTNIAKFDLSLSLMESNDGMFGSFEYNTDLFDEETILRLQTHFELLLNRIISNSELPLNQIPLLSEDEKQTMLSLSNDNYLEFSNSKCIHQYIEEQVEKNPNNIALVFEGTELTYAELNIKANQLAHYITKTKVKPDDLIGISLERNIEMVIAIIAILKTGAAYVPIDPNYPEQRIKYILNDANPKVFITKSSLGIIAQNKNCVTINLDSVQNEIKNESTENLISNVDEENIAYIIYTSGSTGNPKGVMVTHGNVSRLFKSTNVDYGFNSKDIWTFFHSFAFDFSVWELWGALFYGGKVVIVPYSVSRNPFEFYELLRKEKVTILSQTPSAFTQLIKVDESFDDEQKLNLKKVIFGGDKLDIQSLQPWFNKYGDKQPQLINMYGITETTVHVTYRRLFSNDLTSATGSVIGKPLSDLQIYILDEMLEPVPIGVPGEIYVGGAGLTRGYRNLPELTADRFIPNPFRSKSGERMYKTGDLARFLSNGDIEYLSRVDNQVQIYGFRVELGEIENSLSEHSNIKQAVVLVKGADENKRIISYIVQNNNDKKLSTTELRKYLETKIPEYMLPSAYINMEEFPLTEHGKINYKILPEPGPERPELESKFVKPSSEDEMKLEKIWKQLLNVKEIGVNDSFFDLGGDSILSIQMIALSKEDDLNLTPRQVFQNPTIKELAILGREAEDITNAEQGIVSGKLPLTPIQKWFFEHHPNSYNRFNTSMFLELFTKIDLESIKIVISHLVNHHDILRLELSNKEGKWQQEILPTLDDLPIIKIDLSKVKDRKLKDAIAKEVEKIQSSFDVTKAPLFRLVYFNLGEKRNDQLLLVFHHLVSDGVSWRIIMSDIVSLFTKVLTNKEVTLPAKSTSYKTWSDEISKYAQQEKVKEEIKYWSRINTRNITKLPVDFIGGENTYGSTESYTVSLEKELSQKLIKEIPQKMRTQLFDILIAVLLRSFGKTEKTKYLIELEGHGREDIINGIDLSRTVGWFTSIYPVQIDLTNTRDIEHQIRRIKNTIKLIPNKGVGYSLLKYLSGDEKIKNTFKEIPTPEINFNFLGKFDQMSEEGEAPFTISPFPMGMEQSPNTKRANLLYVVAVINGGMLHIRWLYSKNIHKQKTIKKFAKNYISELKKILKDY